MPGFTPGRLSGRQISTWLDPRDRVAAVICAALTFGAALVRHSWEHAALSALLAAITATITLIDLRHFRIPDLLSLPLIPIGLFASFLAQAALEPRIIAMITVWGVLTLIQRAFSFFRGQEGIGSGDVKLMAASAVWLDPMVLPTYVLASAATALCEGLLRRVGHHGRIAFGAHLAPWLVVFVLIG